MNIGYFRLLAKILYGLRRLAETALATRAKFLCLLLDDIKLALDLSQICQ